jgi:opacity protein-like surface antigen
VTRAAAWIASLALLSALGAALPARAEKDFARRGFYLQAGLNIGFDDFDSLVALNRRLDQLPARPYTVQSSLLVPTGVSASNFLGFNLAAGYRAARRLALEAAFTWSRADLHVDWTDVTNPGEPTRLTGRHAHLTVWSAMTNAKVFLLTGRFQPFALGGIGLQYATPVDRRGVPTGAYGFTSQLGAGLDAYITRHIAAETTFAYQFGTGDTHGSSLGLFTVSLSYRF